MNLEASDIDDDLLRLIFTACHPVLSTEARVALTLRLLGGLSTPEQLFQAESALLEDSSIIPLAHLPETYGMSSRVRNWAEPQTGGWPLADVWLEASAVGGHP